MHKEAFEPTGLIPRSIIRTFDRFCQQLLPGTEQIAIQEYRISRYQILVSIKALCTLIFVPFFVTSTVKFFLITPVTEHFWDYQQGDIFLNSYQEKRAFNEMHDFSEKIFFESLVNSSGEEGWDEERSFQSHLPATPPLAQAPAESNGSSESEAQFALAPSDVLGPFRADLQHVPVKELPSKLNQVGGQIGLPYKIEDFVRAQKQSFCEASLAQRSCARQQIPAYAQPTAEQAVSRPEGSQLQGPKTSLNLQIRFQKKSLEIAETYNKQSILAITCLLGDFVTLLTLYILFVLPQMKPQVIILKSFLTESLYSLSDTTKSFLLILGMDLLVGFHSPRGWEIVLEGALRRFGLPENESFILLFVALFPVFLDTVFKYWIFRYLNKISPSTVVTYHSMLE